MSRCVLLAALIASTTPAYAEDVVAYQTEGDAPASGADSRTMALDEAFANAVTTAMSELVEPAIRTARKGLQFVPVCRLTGLQEETASSNHNAYRCFYLAADRARGVS